MMLTNNVVSDYKKKENKKFFLVLITIIKMRHYTLFSYKNSPTQYQSQNLW